MRRPETRNCGILHIRILEPEDLDFALGLTNAEGWSYTRGELERMLRMDPEGSFVCEDQKPLGFITCVTYGHTGVVGHLVVSKDTRGRRFGHSLLKTAVDYMSDRGADSMMLFSTDEGVGLYSQYGFVTRREVSCIHVAVGGDRKVTTPTTCSLIDREDLPEIIEMDSQIFGDDRTQLIDLLYEEFPKNAFKIQRDGRILGFSFGRATPTGFDLGPWVCSSGSQRDAEDLFKATVLSLGDGTVFLGVFSDNPMAVEIANSMRRVRYWRTHLMIRGEERYCAHLDKLFGVAAFELG
jgi:ribosomal protein S18 acetylase RimI-like enzyme